MQVEATHTLRQLQETDSLKSGPKGSSKTEARADIKKSPLENQLHSRHKAATEYEGWGAWRISIAQPQTCPH